MARPFGVRITQVTPGGWVEFEWEVPTNDVDTFDTEWFTGRLRFGWSLKSGSLVPAEILLRYSPSASLIELIEMFDLTVMDALERWAHTDGAEEIMESVKMGASADLNAYLVDALRRSQVAAGFDGDPLDYFKQLLLGGEDRG